MKPMKKPRTAPEDVVETFDCDQGSEEWFALRLGLPTASVFHTIMADGRDGEASKTRTKLLHQLAGEILSKRPAETYENDAMRRGRAMEAEAIEHHAYTRAVEVRRVGFVRRTIYNPLGDDLVVGCSPDGLVGDAGVLQIKTMRPELIVALVESGRFPSEHRAQCQGEMWVTGRRTCDLRIFYSGMPISPTFRLERDDVYIFTIRTAVEIFAYDLRQLVERVKKKGGVR